MKLKIKIMNKEEIEKEIDCALEKSEKGVLKEDEEIIYLTPNQVSNIFSTKRVEILHYLAVSKPSSEEEIAKALNRDMEDLIRDLKYLEGFGLIQLKKVKEHSIPSIMFEESIMAFA